MKQKKINEVFTNSDVDEHLDVVGGPETDKLDTCIKIIKSTWESQDDFWIVEIKARIKDHYKYNIPSASIGGFVGTAGNRVGYAFISGKTCEEAIESLKNVKITLFDWAVKFTDGQKEIASTDGNMNAVYMLCNKFFARAYFSINKRSMSQTIRASKTKNGNEFDFLNVAIYGKGYNLITFIDCDIDPDTKSKLDPRKRGEDKIKELVNLLKDNNITILKTELSHNGVHIYIPTREYKLKKKIIDASLSNDFNSRVKTIDGERFEFSDNKSTDEPVKFKDNSYILLYSPCGKKPTEKVYYNTDFHVFPKAKRYGTSNAGGEKYNASKAKHNKPDSPHTIMYNNLKKNFAQYSINEEDIKLMVLECVNKILTESDVNMGNGIGTKGPLMPNMLLQPSEIFKDTIELYDKCKKSCKTGRDFLKINIDKVFANDAGYHIWKNYVSSMTGLNGDMEPLLDKKGKQIRDKDGDPIFRPVLNNVKRAKARDSEGQIIKDKDGNVTFEEYPKTAISFFHWIENLTQYRDIDEFGGLPTRILAYNIGNAYIFGYFNLGLFIANSFSGTKADVFRIVREICQYNNIVFSVSMDLAGMLLGLGLYTNGDIHSTKFGGRTVRKMSLTTNKDLLGVISKIDKRSDEFEKEREVRKQNQQITNNNDEKPVNTDFLADIIKDKGVLNFALKNPKLIQSVFEDPKMQDKLNNNPDIVNNVVEKIFNGFNIQQQNRKKKNSHNKK